jgi:hypothetical protein
MRKGAFFVPSDPGQNQRQTAALSSSAQKFAIPNQNK